jgi:hypothetical protein
MHFSVVHFLINLMYLAICAGITFGYTVILYALYVLVRKGIYVWKKSRLVEKLNPDPTAAGEKIPPPPALSFINRKFNCKAAILVVVLILSIYGHARMSWMGPESRHPEAKEYWTAGQVVYAHRYILERVLHPDNPIIKPYTLLQRAIFARGEKLLPEDDGERDVWRNVWFIYPYSRTVIRPYGVGNRKYEPRMVALLDECWLAMEGMATRKIADPKMKRKALLEFPFVVSYYVLWHGHYTGKFTRSGSLTITDRYYVARNRQMLKWLDELHQSWENNHMLGEIWQDYPYVAAAYQFSLMDLLQDLNLSLVYFEEFSCDHLLLKRMYKLYQDVMSDDPARNSFLNLQRKSASQASLHYRAAVYSPVSSAGNYLLSHVCGRKMPEEKYLLVKRHGMRSKFFNQRGVEFVFSKELKPLLEGEKDGK